MHISEKICVVCGVWCVTVCVRWVREPNGWRDRTDSMLSFEWQFHFFFTLFSPPVVCMQHIACMSNFIFSSNTLTGGVIEAAKQRISKKKKRIREYYIFFSCDVTLRGWRLKIQHNDMEHKIRLIIIPRTYRNERAIRIIPAVHFVKAHRVRSPPWIDFNHNLYFGSPSLATALFFFFSIYFSANYK